jgi:hypothetical protein
MAVKSIEFENNIFDISYEIINPTKQNVIIFFMGSYPNSFLKLNSILMHSREGQKKELSPNLEIPRGIFLHLKQYQNSFFKQDFLKKVLGDLFFDFALFFLPNIW